MDKVIVYRRRGRLGGRPQWRWHYLSAGNRKKLAEGGEGYTNLGDLLESLAQVLDLPATDDRYQALAVSIESQNARATFYRKGLYGKVLIEVQR